uniref:SOWAHA-C winged helix-turn-helix domain-containing protein n=1 Tax=Periophthalmus magnuspinnatus TaxID=409849 RepID=A0A3B4AWR2_9GOBI
MAAKRSVRVHPCFSSALNTMALTQESILSFLLEHGGKVKNSDFLNHFRSRIHSPDPAEKQHNRDLFKKLVNSVAVVRTMDDTKFVVVKKRYLDFVKDAPRCASPRAHKDDTLTSHTSVSSASPLRSPCVTASYSDTENNNTCVWNLNGSYVKAKAPADSAQSERASPDSVDATTVRVLNIPGPQVSPKKVPPSVSPAPESEEALGRLDRQNSKQGGETKYSESVPLDPLTHEWMVTCAAGLWSQIYALLLQDIHLIQRQDFISGFTVLHWAAKDGNCDTMRKIMDIARKRRAFININVKAHGGYTPLHIAAIHGHTRVLILLVQGYGANVNLRDNDGRKAAHYLSSNVLAEVKGLLGTESCIWNSCANLYKSILSD